MRSWNVLYVIKDSRSDQYCSTAYKNDVDVIRGKGTKKSFTLFLLCKKEIVHPKGGKMGAGEFIEKMDNVSLRCFERGAEIAEFLRPIFPMSEIEGDRLVGYMEGHGYLLGSRDGKLYRGDLCYDYDKICWGAYTLYDAVENVRDWNHEILEEAGIDPEADGAAEHVDGDRYTAGLWEDKEILDGVFERIWHRRKEGTATI